MIFNIAIVGGIVMASFGIEYKIYWMAMTGISIAQLAMYEKAKNYIF